MTASGFDPSNSHDPGARGPAGFTTQEVFSNIAEFESFIKRMIPTLIMLFLVTALMVALVLSAVGLPGAVAWIIAALASAGFCAVMYQAKKKQFAKVWGTSTLTLSPIGADMQDGNTRVQMSWSQVERIGDASIMGPLRFGGFTDVAKAVGALSAASMKRKEMALLGTARLTVNPDAPAMVKTQVKQNLGGQDPSALRPG